MIVCCYAFWTRIWMALIRAASSARTSCALLRRRGFGGVLVIQSANDELEDEQMYKAAGSDGSIGKAVKGGFRRCLRCWVGCITCALAWPAPATDSDLDTLSPGGSLMWCRRGARFRKAGTSSALEPWATRVRVRDLFNFDSEMEGTCKLQRLRSQ